LFQQQAKQPVPDRASVPQATATTTTTNTTTTTTNSGQNNSNKKTILDDPEWHAYLAELAEQERVQDEEERQASAKQTLASRIKQDTTANTNTETDEAATVLKATSKPSGQAATTTTKPAIRPTSTPAVVKASTAFSGTIVEKGGVGAAPFLTPVCYSCVQTSVNTLSHSHSHSLIHSTCLSQSSRELIFSTRPLPTTHDDDSTLSTPPQGSEQRQPVSIVPTQVLPETTSTSTATAATTTTAAAQPRVSRFKAMMQQKQQ
jgi:hypothetical protein